MASPDVTTRNPTIGFVTVALGTSTLVHDDVTVTVVHVAPLSCVKSMLPVPVMRFTKADVMRAALADVID
jgi:hypothetical protein